MTLLPVVQRELRVSARERNTYRVRFFAAFLPVLFSIFSLWFVRFAFNEQPIPPRELFLFLTWIAYIFVSFAGFSLTCDAISQEKRDSTLGLLFLTDLKGYDVILGKLSVALLRGIYALFATVPVLALPLMLGGTNLTELLRTSATLVATLFFSMSLGLMISSLTRRSWTAFGTSGFVVLLFAAGLPAHSQIVRNLFHDAVLANLILVPSPSYTLYMSFRNAIGLRGHEFALSLIAVLAIGVLAIVIATLVTPHIWKDRPPARLRARIQERLRSFKFGSPQFRVRFRRRLLDRNSIYWLSRRERISSFGLLMLFFSLGLFACWMGRQDWTWVDPQAQKVFPMLAWLFFGLIAHGLILLRIAVLAAERFGDDRRSGALELILSTPLSIKKILAGHWMGLRRCFVGPALLALGAQLLFCAYLFTLDDDPEFILTLPQVLSEIRQHFAGDLLSHHRWELHLSVIISAGLVPLLLLDWVAIAWLSTWFSLRLKQALFAPIGAIIFLHASPMLLFGFLVGFLQHHRYVPNHNFSEAVFLFAIAAALFVTTQLLAIIWSRRQIYKHFRTAATDRYQPKPPRRWWQFRLA